MIEGADRRGSNLSFTGDRPARLFADDDAGRHRVPCWNPRHHRCVGNAETLSAVDSQAAVHQGHGILSHFGGSAPVPHCCCAVTNELIECRGCARRRHDLPRGRSDQCATRVLLHREREMRQHRARRGLASSIKGGAQIAGLSHQMELAPGDHDPGTDKAVRRARRRRNLTIACRRPNSRPCQPRAKGRWLERRDPGGVDSAR